MFLSGRPGTVARRETEWFQITVTTDVHSSEEGRGARGRETNVLMESEKNKNKNGRKTGPSEKHQTDARHEIRAHV